MTCHLEDTGIGVAGCTVPLDSKETALRSTNLEVSPSADKNTRVVLVPCSTWNCVPTVVSGRVDISEVPECPLLRQMNSSLES